MIQAIGYVRRSTDKQDESLDQQRAKLESYAAAQGWKLVHVYVDDAISGSDMDRPGLLSLMERAEKDADVSAVVTWDRNRLARPKDAVDGLMLERRLLSAGKRVLYVGSGQEADRSFTSGLIGYVEHYQNGDYLRKLSRDTMRGLVSRAKRGQWVAAQSPLGYDRLLLDHDGQPKRIIRDMADRSQLVLHPETGEVLERCPRDHRYEKQSSESTTLVPSEPERVALIRRIFADYVAGKPLRVLRDELNAAGFRSTSGGTFATSSLHVILENPAYTGRLVYNRTTASKWHRLSDGELRERSDDGWEKRGEADWVTVDDAWPALIDRETFDAAQQRLADVAAQQRAVTGRAVRAQNLLVGVSFCGVCGGRMSVHRNGKKRYYVCGVHHEGHRDRCPKRYTIPADLIEQHVLQLIRTDLAMLRDDSKLHEYVAEQFRQAVGNEADTHDRLQRRLADLDQQIAKLRDHLKALDPDTAKSLGLYDQAKSITVERSEVERQLAQASRQIPAMPSPDQIRQRATAAFDQLAEVIAGANIEQKRELISLYVQRIDTDPTTQTISIKMYPPLFSSNITCPPPPSPLPDSRP